MQLPDAGDRMGLPRSSSAHSVAGMGQYGNGTRSAMAPPVGQSKPPLGPGALAEGLGSMGAGECVCV